MNGKTRVIHAITRKPLDRIPCYDAFWEDTITEWQNQGLPPDVNTDEFFDWDFRTMSLDASLRMEQKILKQDGPYMTVQDRAGYTMKKTIGKSRALEFIEHVNKDRETWDKLKHRFQFDPNDRSRLDTKSYFLHLDDYPTWPEAKHQFDTLRKTEKFICFCVYGPWEATWRHRGYSELLMDLVLDPDWAVEMAGAQSELILATLRHAIQIGMKPDGLFLIDDLACTRGLLFSPETWRQIFKPIYRRLGQFLHENNIFFLLHCCGNCELLFPDLIECGVQVIQPLQASAGLDVRKLKSVYGKDLTFWGNIDVTQMSGTPEQCEKELREKISLAKKGGGYIYHSDHSVPPEVTFDRYRWIMELVQKYGSYNS